MAKINGSTMGPAFSLQEGQRKKGPFNKELPAHPYSQPDQKGIFVASSQNASDAGTVKYSVEWLRSIVEKDPRLIAEENPGILVNPYIQKLVAAAPIIAEGVYTENLKKSSDAIQIISSVYKILTKKILEALKLHDPSIDVPEEPKIKDILNAFGIDLITSHAEAIQKFLNLDKHFQIHSSLIGEFADVYRFEKDDKMLDLIGHSLSNVIPKLKADYLAYIGDLISEPITFTQESQNFVINQEGLGSGSESDCNSKYQNLHFMMSKNKNHEEQMSKINQSPKYKARLELSDQTTSKELFEKYQENDRLKLERGEDLGKSDKSIFTDEDRKFMKHFHELDMGRTKEIKEFFSKFSDVDSMDLSGNNIETNHAAKNIVAGIHSSTNLTSLNLSGCSISRITTDKFLPYLFKNIRNLVNLDLSHNGLCRLNFVEMEKIVKVELSFANLTYLNLSNNKIGSISGFGNMPSLTELDLSHNEIMSIHSFGNMPNLTELDLSNNKIRTISGFYNMSSLTNLDLSNNEIGSITDFDNMSSLLNLNLSGNFLRGDYWEKEFSKIMKSVSKLSKLDLSNTHISGAEWSVALPKALENLSDLTDLDLSKNKISGGAWKYEFFDYIAKNTSLRKLDLSNNEILGWTCDTELSEALKTNRTLQYLNLSKNPIFFQELDLTGAECKIDVEIADEISVIFDIERWKKYEAEQLEELLSQNIIGAGAYEEHS